MNQRLTMGYSNDYAPAAGGGGGTGGGAGGGGGYGAGAGSGSGQGYTAPAVAASEVLGSEDELVEGVCTHSGEAG